MSTAETNSVPVSQSLRMLVLFVEDRITEEEGSPPSHPEFLTSLRRLRESLEGLKTIAEENEDGNPVAEETRVFNGSYSIAMIDDNFADRRDGAPSLEDVVQSCCMSAYSTRTRDTMNALYSAVRVTTRRLDLTMLVNATFKVT